MLMALTAYLLYLLVSRIESNAMHVAQPLMGDFYLPSQGILLGILAILGLVFFDFGTLHGHAFSWIEMPMTHLLVVKSIYNSLKILPPTARRKNSIHSKWFPCACRATAYRLDWPFPIKWPCICSWAT